MSDEEQVRLGHQNLIGYNRAMTHWCQQGCAPSKRTARSLRRRFVDPARRQRRLLHRGDRRAPCVLEQADTFFARRKRGYSVKVRDSGEDADLQAACEAHGLVAFGDPIPQMICRQRLECTASPGGSALREVRDEEGVADFAAVNADAYATYGMPAEVFVDMFDRPGPACSPDADQHRGGLPGLPAGRHRPVVRQRRCRLPPMGRHHRRRSHMSLGRVVTEWATNRPSTGRHLGDAPGVRHGRAPLRQAGLRDAVPLPGVRALGGTDLATEGAVTVRQSPRAVTRA
jgi:hypothetical protein